MNAQQVDQYLIQYGRYFENHHVPRIREQLLNVDESKWANVLAADLKDPLIMMMLSLTGGTLGIDRFVNGETGLGVGKLLTCGGFGIWVIVDWFMIMGAVRERNVMNLQQALM